MPVRFTCSVCNQLLSIGRRKIGSEVVCPKCKSRILVPAPEPAAVHAAAEESEARAAVGQLPDADFTPFMYDDVPTLVVVPSNVATSGTRSATQIGTVNISRTILYAQAALIALVAVIGFSFGYLSGRIAGPVAPAPAAEAK